MKLCTCAQSMALGTCTKFQLEILIRRKISVIHKFQENILESLRNVSETPPQHLGPNTYMYCVVSACHQVGWLYALEMTHSS